MIKLGVVTSTRAEYGLLYPILEELRKKEDSDFRVDLLVTGTHLSREFGFTVDEITDDGVRIDYRVHIPVDNNSPLDISRNQAITLVRFSQIFKKEKYNAVVLLGDRYEMLAVAVAAGNFCVPLFHISGGDSTEGAIDEWIRHSITKMSYLHFPTNEQSRRRIIQLGEDPKRVFNYGSTCVDNITKLATMSKQEVLDSVGVADKHYAVCTYHPETMRGGRIETQVNEILKAVKAFPEFQFLFTKSNADMGGSKVNNILEEAKKSIPNLYLFPSLGVRKYLSLLRFSDFVLGNSSSGILEAPAFQIPTINLGNRQKGRLRSKSVIDCEVDHTAIIHSIEMVTTEEFKDSCRHFINPYGDGNAAKRISDKIMEVTLEGRINLSKEFYNLPGGRGNDVFS